MRVFVTGASGFLGGVVCRLLTDAGHDVDALVRRRGSAPPGTRPIEGDLLDGGRLRRALDADEPDCVIHLAAEIASQKDPRRIRLVNVEGTKRLLEACTATGSPRFVFASTVVTGDAEGRTLDESTPLPVHTAYGRSKQIGERLVRDSGLDAVVVRPSHVYGPGGWFVDEFVTRLRQPGRFAVIGRGDNWWDVVHVDDVAAAIVAVAERATACATYHVVDDEPIRFYDFIALTARALGLGAPRRVPVALARLVGGRDPVLASTRSARSSNARIKADLGWTPRYPTAREGVPAAVAALQPA